MHFNNYFVEHVRGDMRWWWWWWGGGSSRKCWIKKGGHLLFTWSAGGRLTEILIFPTYFSLPPPHPLYINNDRSLNQKCICWVSQWLDTQQPGNVFKILDTQLQQSDIHIPFSQYIPFNSSKIYLFRSHKQFRTFVLGLEEVEFSSLSIQWNLNVFDTIYYMFCGTIMLFCGTIVR